MFWLYTFIIENHSFSLNFENKFKDNAVIHLRLLQVLVLLAFLFMTSPKLEQIKPYFQTVPGCILVSLLFSIINNI